MTSTETLTARSSNNPDARSGGPLRATPQSRLRISTAPAGQRRRGPQKYQTPSGGPCRAANQRAPDEQRLGWEKHPRMTEPEPGTTRPAAGERVPLLEPKTHRPAGVLAVEMEAAALSAFADATRSSVVCLAHLTNELGSQGDFDKARPAEPKTHAYGDLRGPTRPRQRRRPSTTGLSALDPTTDTDTPTRSTPPDSASRMELTRAVRHQRPPDPRAAHSTTGRSHRRTL